MLGGAGRGCVDEVVGALRGGEVDEEDVEAEDQGALVRAEGRDGGPGGGAVGAGRGEGEEDAVLGGEEVGDDRGGGGRGSEGGLEGGGAGDLALLGPGEGELAEAGDEVNAEALELGGDAGEGGGGDAVVLLVFEEGVGPEVELDVEQGFAGGIREIGGDVFTTS